MKKRKIGLIALFVILAALLVCWLAELRRAQRDEATLADTAPLHSTPHAGTPPSSSNNILDRNREAVSFVKNTMDSRLESRTPIVFYGKILDEREFPVAGAEVKYGANSLEMNLLKEKRYQGTVRSDARGFFSISGIRGRDLSLSIAHPEYYNCSSNLDGFAYLDEMKTRGVPDSEDKAVIFRMVRKRNPVPLISHRASLRVPYGSDTQVSLRGRAAAETACQILIEASAAPPKTADTERHNWKVRLTIPTGGILEATNEIEFLAPENGYRNSWEFSAAEDDPAWKSHFEKKFFLNRPNISFWPESLSLREGIYSFQ